MYKNSITEIYAKPYKKTKYIVKVKRKLNNKSHKTIIEYNKQKVIEIFYYTINDCDINDVIYILKSEKIFKLSLFNNYRIKVKNKYYFPERQYGPTIILYLSSINGSFKEYQYKKNGLFHRKNKPALIKFIQNDLNKFNKTEENYILNGKFHNTKGAALIYYHNNEITYKEYWIHGICLLNVRSDKELRLALTIM